MSVIVAKGLKEALDAVIGYDRKPISVAELEVLILLRQWFPGSCSTLDVHEECAADGCSLQATCWKLIRLRHRGYVVSFRHPGCLLNWQLGPLADDLMERGLL